jgi:transcriptional regulator with XRE-family HTH domain
MDIGEQLNSRPEKRLIDELQDADYRRAFVEGHATDTIAFQLRTMRKAEGWEQKDVAEKLGNRKLQPMISRYENPDYGKYSISTLLELAAVFDVALAVRFVPFSELAEWDLSSSPAKECPAPFIKDSKLEEIANGAKDSANNLASGIAADGDVLEGTSGRGAIRIGSSSFNENEFAAVSGGF